MPPRLVPLAGSLQQDGQPVMGLGELGVARDQLAGEPERQGGVRLFQAAGAPDLAGRRRPARPGASRDAAPIGWGRSRRRSTPG